MPGIPGGIPSDASRSYPAFLDRLRSYERFEPVPKSRGPEKLEGVRRLAAALRHPERHGRVVHLAGTNGKGMTATMIAALLQGAGHPTGLYTSPHVLDVRERISVRGAPIAERTFAEAGHAVLDLADELRESIHFSYFDLLTLIAWVAFRAEGMHWVVLETGLGGLSDATNLGPKELCVLTRIGLDHLHVLGDTLEAIAAQKLGIVPPGKPVVLAGQPGSLRPWLRERLAAQGSPVHDVEAFTVRLAPDDTDTVEAFPAGAGGPVARLRDPRLAARCSGPRLACAATALVAADVLVGPTDAAGLTERLRTVLEIQLPGRLELRHDQAVAGVDGPVLHTVALDGGHNPEAVAALNAQLRRWGLHDYTLVLSLQRDKLVPALRGALRDLLAGARRLVLLAPQTARAPSEAELRDYLAELLPPGVAVQWVASAGEALQAAAESPERPLVVTGSFWMLGDVMHLLRDAVPSQADAAEA